MIITNYGANPPTIMEVLVFIQIVDHKRPLLTTSPFGKKWANHVNFVYGLLRIGFQKGNGENTITLEFGKLVSSFLLA